MSKVHSNTLDRILARIARSENDKTDAMTGASFLFDVFQRMNKEMSEKSSYGDREFVKYREYVLHIETKANHLLLILTRLRETASSPYFRSTGAETRTVRYFLIDLESFFHHAASILYLLARLTPYFYRARRRQFPSKSFEKQRKWFEENPDFDRQYSQIIKERTSWFDESQQHRVNLTHYSGPFSFWDGTGTHYFGTQRDKNGFIPNQDTLEYINKTANDIIEFLTYFNDYFGKQQCIAAN